MTKLVIMRLTFGCALALCAIFLGLVSGSILLGAIGGIGAFVFGNVYWDRVAQATGCKLVPGGSAASFILQRDVLNTIWISESLHSDRKRWSIVDTEILTVGQDVAISRASSVQSGTWTERWHLDRSGKIVPYDITFTSDGHGGTYFAVNRAESPYAEPKDRDGLGRQSAAPLAESEPPQAMIQEIREAECNAVFDEYAVMKGDLVDAPIVRHEGEAAIVALGKTEAILPHSEQIPGQTHHVGERVKALILDLRKVGDRVEIILSRTHPDFVRRLFENEIPEIANRTIEIKALAREAGYRAKIAVSSIDLKVDCVGACVGVRGSHIKNVVDELGGERIDIVRWNDSLQVMIPNALMPAKVEEVFLYQRLGRAIVILQEDELPKAIGDEGDNVRCASRLVGWDIELMTLDELNGCIERALVWFAQIPGVTDTMVEAFIEEGFLTYDDLTFLKPAQLADLAHTTEVQAEEIIHFAEEAAKRVEKEART